MLWHKSKKIWTGFFILVLAYGYIIYRLGQIDFTSVNCFKSSKSFSDILLFVGLQISLLSLNVSFESLKWRRLMSREYRFSFLESLQMVLAGFASGIFTPAKLGEPIGRFLFLPKQKWLKATSLSYLGGFVNSVLIIVLGVGASGCLSFLIKENFIADINKYGFVVLILIVAGALLVFWAKEYLKKLLQYFKWKDKISQMYTSFKRLSRMDILLVIFFSLLRYCTFCTQLYLLFHFLQPGLNIELMLWIFVYYMGVTVLPGFILADLGIRNSLGLFMFSFMKVNELVILSSVSVLWVVNQVIPAVIGGLLVLRLKRK